MNTGKYGRYFVYRAENGDEEPRVMISPGYAGWSQYPAISAISKAHKKGVTRWFDSAHLAKGAAQRLQNHTSQEYLVGTRDQHDLMLMEWAIRNGESRDEEELQWNVLGER